MEQAAQNIHADFFDRTAKKKARPPLREAGRVQNRGI
jgi:hypothetical protein